MTDRAATIACLLLLAAVALLDLDTIKDPHYWDAIQGVIEPALDSFDHGLRILHGPTLDFGHPPLLPVALALLWHASGPSLVVSHLAILAVGLAGLYLTFRLGTAWFGPGVGLAAATLLAFNQMFVAQLGMVSDAIPLLTLNVLVVWSWSQRRRAVFLVAGILLALAKETAVVLFLALALHRLLEAWLAQRRITRADLRAAALAASPILVVLFWLAYQKLMIGWAINRDHLPSNEILALGPLRLVRFFAGRLVKDVLRYLWLDLGPFRAGWFNGILSLAIVWASLARREVRPRYRLVALVLGLHFLLFALTMDLPRYFVPLWPFYYVIGAHAASLACASLRLPRLACAALVVALALLFTTGYRGRRTEQGFLLETNREYRDAIAVQAEAAQFLEAAYPDTPILTVWPMTDELTEPRLGYVTRPLRVVREPRDGPLVLCRPTQSADPEFPRTMDLSAFELVRHFERNRKAVEIYVQRTPAAVRPAGQPMQHP